MGRYKKYLTLFMIFSIFMIPFNANASTNMQGWSLSNPVVNGASVLYQGLKNVMINGKNVVKTSTAIVKPTATQVAKVLAKGASAYALSVAVAQLIGDGVDWVLDPANNQIRYNDSEIKANYFKISSFETHYDSYNALISALTLQYNCKRTEVVTPWSKPVQGSSQQRVKCFTGTTGTAGSEITVSAYGVSDEKNKTIPLPTVAAQVISNAETGDSNAKVAVATAAQDVVNDAENDSTKARPILDQLEANATTQTDADANSATGQTKPNTETGGNDLSIEFPAFCGWAPLVCEAAQIAISFPQTITQWWEDANKSISEAWTLVKDWVKEPEKEETELDIENPEQNEPDTKINFSTACPQKIPLQFGWNGNTLDFSFDFTIWCDAVSTFIYPIVVALGSLHALYIVAGVRQDG